MSRKNLIQLMTVVVIVLGAAALFLAVRYFQQSQAPNSGEAATGNLACGSQCTTDADCTSPSPTGATVKCLSGICANINCPTDTIPGANCDCPNLNDCGEACSASEGLCNAGSACGFIGSPAQCAAYTNQHNGHQYCLPTTPSSAYKTVACTDGVNAVVLQTASGATVTTQAQVLDACKKDVCGDGRCSGTETAANCSVDCTRCGDGLCTGTETNASCAIDCPKTCGNGICSSDENVTTCAIDCSVCNDGVCNGSETAASCPVDCKLPVTGVLDDGLGPVIFGILFILFGISFTRRNSFRFLGFNLSLRSKKRSDYDAMVDSWIKK